MQSVERLLIFGASARAAAFSALRAGLAPWCADLFADADLRRRCPAMRMPGDYPDGYRGLIGVEARGPWMYTGALENHPKLVGDLAARRPLWGNGRRVLGRCRLPGFLFDVARRAGLPAPAVAGLGAVSGDGRWLVKPLRGSAGGGVRFWQGERLPSDSPVYFQHFIDGTPASALFVGAERSASLLGLTRQLIGEAWLKAKPFAYCGNVGPLNVEPRLRDRIQRLGELLAHQGELRGLFGIDGILSGGDFWPVEINPRYTAAVEVLEYATGLRALDLHRRAFEAPTAPLPDVATSGQVVGKAIVYAAADGVFPDGGPWAATLRSAAPVEEMPAFADLPAASEPVQAGAPVLTLLEAADGVEACVERLRERAAEVIAWLGRGGGGR